MSAANGTDLSPPDAGGGLDRIDKTVMGGALGGAVTEATVGLERAWEAIMAAPGQAEAVLRDIVPVDLPFDMAAKAVDTTVFPLATEVVSLL